MDTKVQYVVQNTACPVHGVSHGIACWSTPSRTDGLPPVVGVCMRRAANAGILTLEYKRQWLGIKKAA